MLCASLKRQNARMKIFRSKSTGRRWTRARRRLDGERDIFGGDIRMYTRRCVSTKKLTRAWCRLLLAPRGRSINPAPSFDCFDLWRLCHAARCLLLVLTTLLFVCIGGTCFPPLLCCCTNFFGGLTCMMCVVSVRCVLRGVALHCVATSRFDVEQAWQQFSREPAGAERGALDSR